MKINLSKRLLLGLFTAILIISSCYRLKSSRGGGQISGDSARYIDTADIALPDGYTIEVVTTGLTFPTGITFDDDGQPYITEAGYTYGEEWTQPKLIRINPSGNTTIKAGGKKDGPWNGVDYQNGYFYIAEGGHLKGGKIIRISPQGNVKTLVDNLPGYGDHHTNGPVVRDDGYIYFGQGTATNSGVAGNDNAGFGWLKRNEQFHDIPCEDITLTGKNFETEDVLDGNSDKAITGAYSPYGTATEKGEVIEGELPCNGAVMKIPIAGGPLELVAWGFRNPFGLAFSPEGELYVTDNGYDDRGSRPVWGTGDLLWEVETGTWYGWPDFSGQQSLESNEFQPPGENPIVPLLEKHPNKPPEPSAILGVHSSSNGMDFSTNSSFGYTGNTFIAQFGDMAPAVGKVISPVGFKVVTVDVSTGIIEDFAVNKGKRNGPASWLEKGGLERPVDVAFGPTGNALYIVDFGIVKMSEEGPKPQRETGVVFKITRETE